MGLRWPTAAIVPMYLLHDAMPQSYCPCHSVHVCTARMHDLTMLKHARRWQRLLPDMDTMQQQYIQCTTVNTAYVLSVRTLHTCTPWPCSGATAADRDCLCT